MNSNEVVFDGESDEKRVIYDYIPKKFPIKLGEVSNDFISKQKESKNDFVLSDLVAGQTGIANLQQRELEEKIEVESLNKLKQVQEKAYKEAYGLGLIEGVEKAFVEKKNEIDERITKMEVMLNSMAQLTTNLVAEKEHQILKLITLLASKIAMFEIQSNPEKLYDLITNLFEEMQSDERVVLRLSSEDLIFIEGVREKLGIEYSINNVKLQIDNDVESGGCILESNYGMIDASIEQRVERAWGAIKARLPRLDEDRIEIESLDESTIINPDKVDVSVQANAQPATEEKTDSADTENEINSVDIDKKDSDDEDDNDGN